MPEAIPFLTGHIVSTETSTQITTGTAPENVDHAKNRHWVITDGANAGASLPINHYRHMVVVDNTQSDTAACVTYGDSGSLDLTADGNHDIEIPAGAMWEMPKPVTKGLVAVQLLATSGTGPCIVLETSYI